MRAPSLPRFALDILPLVAAGRSAAAHSRNAIGPFTGEPAPISGSFSINPAVFIDTDGTPCMYFGG